MVQINIDRTATVGTFHCMNRQEQNLTAVYPGPLLNVYHVTSAVIIQPPTVQVATISKITTGKKELQLIK